MTRLPALVAQIPRGALILGLAGVLPFIWGALTDMISPLQTWAGNTISPRLAGQYVLIFYGTIILSFMSGVLWGFATRASGRTATVGYAVSTAPALWAFFMVGGAEDRAVQALIVGYLGLLCLDFGFWRLRLAPPWWMTLRTILTTLVLACLCAGLVF
jgi:hypothetical protein